MVAVQCHVTVRFPGHAPLHYRADTRVARRFAEAANAMGRVLVGIDLDMRKALRPLPCQLLWQ
ncbi:MAG: hypothetical protein JWN03_3335 [Nocardia sp.]|uniref:hypothetical protein n=1 Tax=Nocardia sp. TaxID=1821 RepID=UPI002622B43C|nr:hypothetical protein [Nocardia sp.]MCU1643060.1 hypothetical protein [Nocardia sp.]